MTIQINTDNTLDGNEKNQDYFTKQITEELKIYKPHITRIEVHLTDENGNKDGVNDMACSLEARLKGMKPIAVTSQANTIEFAVLGALDKIKASMKTILGRISNQ